MNAINKCLEWITKLAYLNVLWLVFTLVGLVVIGFFPATGAMFAVTRKWLAGETDIATFKTFWSVYKKEMIKSNILGYILSVVGYILYLDFVFLTVAPSNLLNMLVIPFVIISVITIATAFYVFPVFVHYNMKLSQVMKNSFFIMFMNPLPTLIMLVGTLGILYVLWQFQGLFLFFSGSIFAIVITMPAQRAFEKVSHKQEMYTQNAN